MLTPCAWVLLDQGRVGQRFGEVARDLADDRLWRGTGGEHAEPAIIGKIGQPGLGEGRYVRQLRQPGLAGDRQRA
jgi:hypothetical protein